MSVVTNWTKESSMNTVSTSWTTTNTSAIHPDTGTSWTSEDITPSTIWNGTLASPISTSWNIQEILPLTEWIETLEQFYLWEDGNDFWENINTNYEDF